MTKRLNIEIALLILLMPVLIAVLSISRLSRTDEISSTGGDTFSITNNPIPSYYLQVDDRWKNDDIGGSKEPISSVGCTLCCVCMSLSQLGFDIDPGELNLRLIENDGYTEQGWLKWNSVTQIFEDKIRFEIPKRPTHKAIDKALRSNHSVIAKILLNECIPHWVLIVGKNDNDYVIMNPLDKKESLQVLSQYSSNIYSIRILKK